MYYDEGNFYSILINDIRFNLMLSVERYPIKLDYDFNEMLLLLREYKFLEEYKELYMILPEYKNKILPKNANKPFKNSNYIKSDEIFDKTTDIFIWHPRLCVSIDENNESPIINWVRNKKLSSLDKESKHFNPSWCKFVLLKLLGYNYESKVWFDPNIDWLDRWFTSLSMNLKYVAIDKNNISEYVPQIILHQAQNYDVIFTELRMEDLDIIIEAVEYLKLNHYLALCINHVFLQEIFNRINKIQELKPCGYLIVKNNVIWIWMKISQNIS